MKCAVWFEPARLARYIARSASPSIRSTSAYEPSAQTSPTDDVTRSRIPARSIGSASRARNASAQCVVPDVGPVAKHGELVTAEARHDVVRSGQAAQPVGHDLQHPVTDAMAEPVVDLLEPVEVHEHQRDLAAVEPTVPQRAAGPGDQHAAVDAAR